MKVSESTISPQWATTIPKEVRPWLKAERGEKIEWHINNGEVIVKKKVT